MNPTIKRYSAADVPEAGRPGFWVHAGDLNQALALAANREAALQQRLNIADQRVDDLQAQLANLIPEGYCIMPRRLTAENGAKALLLGEFKVTFAQECPECRDLAEPAEGCAVCDGEGEFASDQLISWDKIKHIYSQAVTGLATKIVTETAP
ncbi:MULTISPECIES: hypothetical protein [unclassified Pseudomonas]|uniref:hypothetical protein n=1 Tax=unclassified Pseudomonas TaxID=196821 RepID=UPI0025D97238|nr:MULTISPECIES: hypothetical protein [unclassified Pseudomonas]